MTRDDRDILDVLKFELSFLEKGGYGRSPREPWRQPLVLEDSPTCMNYDSKTHPAPCDECILMQLVPPAERDQKVPCRHIPLTPEGETLDYFYRWGTQIEIEEAMKKWLVATIQRLEKERESVPAVGSASPKPSVH
jgi:hypothetical protein